VQRSLRRSTSPRRALAEAHRRAALWGPSAPPPARALHTPLHALRRSAAPRPRRSSRCTSWRQRRRPSGTGTHTARPAPRPSGTASGRAASCGRRAATSRPRRGSRAAPASSSWRKRRGRRCCSRAARRTATARCAAPPPCRTPWDGCFGTAPLTRPCWRASPWRRKATTASTSICSTARRRGCGSRARGRAWRRSSRRPRRASRPSAA
jgi:hypothetical protein